MLMLLSLIFILLSQNLKADTSVPYNMLLADHTLKSLFLYSKTEGIVWRHPGKALFDAWVLDDGSIIFSTARTVEKIIPDIQAGEGAKKIWTYQYGAGFKRKKNAFTLMFYITGLNQIKAVLLKIQKILLNQKRVF